MKKRNSLIELYRFIFALNVVKGHGFMPIQLPYFGPATISVEFFFVLSGYLLIRSIDKYRDEFYPRGLFHFIISKLKPLAIPLIVAIPFNILYELVVEDGSLNIWGFLWYVREMFKCFILYYTLRKIFKSDRALIITAALIFTCCAVMHCTEEYYSHGSIRAGMSISLGILLSFIPMIKPKRALLPWLAVIPLFSASMIIMAFYLANELWIEMILDVIIYPALIYFSFAIPVSIAPLNYLGTISFGLYAFQCVVRPLDAMGYNNTAVMFLIIVVLALAEDGAKRLYRYLKAHYKPTHPEENQA